jgi:outer membrane protein assembly factor BamB
MMDCSQQHRWRRGRRFWKAQQSRKLIILLFAAAVVVTLSRSGGFAIECGDTGNLYWTYSQTNGVPGQRAVALDSTRVYWAVGSTLLQLTKDGAPVATRDLVSYSVGRPLVVDTQHGVTDMICFAAGNGYVFALDPNALGLPTLWSRNLRRPSCNGDVLNQTLALQVWDLSDATYRAAQNTDLVIAGTRHACSSSTANKVYALDGANGNVRWTFNATGGYLVEPVTGLALDYARNLVYVTTEQGDPTQSQVSVCALRTTNGTRLWGVDLGDVAAPPLLANDALYVVDYDGLLSKLNPATGATLWSLQVATGGQVVTQDMSYSTILQRVFLTPASATGSEGVIVAVDDLGSSGQVVWQTSASGPGSLGSVETAPEVLDAMHAVYAGVAYGGVVQLGVCQGYLQHGDLAFSNVDDIVVDTFDAAHPRLYVTTQTTSISKLCIPWPANEPGGDPDADNDGIIDCLDGCPNDPLKTDPGLCGCGVPDVGDCGLTGMDDGMPTRFALYGNVPNPFNPTTRIRYDLASRVHVSLDVYHVTGQRVKRLVDEAAGPGEFVTEWDGTNESGEKVSTGVYFCRLSAGSYSQTKRMVLLK